MKANWSSSQLEASLEGYKRFIWRECWDSLLASRGEQRWLGSKDKYAPTHKQVWRLSSVYDLAFIDRPQPPTPPLKLSSCINLSLSTSIPVTPSLSHQNGVLRESVCADHHIHQYRPGHLSLSPPSLC